MNYDEELKRHKRERRQMVSSIAELTLQLEQNQARMAEKEQQHAEKVQFHNSLLTRARELRDSGDIVSAIELLKFHTE